MVRRSFAAALLICLAASGQAATIDFSRLETQDWTAQSTLPGLTIEAGSEVNGTVQTGTASVGHRRFGALGVKSADDTGAPDGTDQLDTVGANDVVVFRFDRAVRLERISFTMTDYWDRFDLYVGEGLEFETTMKVDDLRGYDWVSTIVLGAGYESTSFAIGASEYQSCGYDIKHGHDCWTEHSAFRISSITFSEMATPDDLPSEVPLPASAWLLLAGVLGLGAWRGRGNGTLGGN